MGLSNYKEKSRVVGWEGSPLETFQEENADVERELLQPLRDGAQFGSVKKRDVRGALTKALPTPATRTQLCLPVESTEE